MPACESFFFFQAEDGIRDLVRSRGLGDVYKRQAIFYAQDSSRCSLSHKQVESHLRQPQLRQRRAHELSLIHI